MMGASVLDAYYQKMVWAADETHASAHRLMDEASLWQRYPSQTTPQVMNREYKPIETTIRPPKTAPCLTTREAKAGWVTQSKKRTITSTGFSNFKTNSEIPK